MFWKFILLAFILIFVVLVVMNIYKISCFFMGAISAEDECFEKEFRGLLTRKNLYGMLTCNAIMNILCLANLIILCYISLYGEIEWLTWKWIAGDIVFGTVTGAVAFYMNKCIYKVVAPNVINAERCSEFSGGERVCYSMTQNNNATLILLAMAIAAVALVVLV